MENEMKDIRCRETKRLLAKMNENGIYFFCRHHNESHLISWEELKELEAISKDGQEKRYFVRGEPCH